MWAERRCTNPSRVKGHTLLEVLLSTVIMSIVLVAIVSSMLLAGKAIPGADDPSAAAAAAAGVANQLAGEVQVGLSFDERLVNAVEFTVADRDEDSNPETIRYSWSGTAGDPLQIELNGGPKADLLDGIDAFDLSYDTRVVTVLEPTPDVLSSEVEHASYPTAVNPNLETVTSTNSLAQHFTPTLPPPAIDWAVTRVLFRARKEGEYDGTVGVQLRPPTGGNQPMAGVLEEVLMQESDLSPSFAWVQFDFTKVEQLHPDRGLCLVLKWQAGTDAAGIEVDLGGGTGLLDSFNGNSVWTKRSKAMMFYVYGTYSTPGPDAAVDHTFLTAVRVELQKGPDTTARVRTAASILDPPEIVVAPVPGP